jgi:hypothetical protein
MDPDQGYWIWVLRRYTYLRKKGVDLLVQIGKQIHLFWRQHFTFLVEGGSELRNSVTGFGNSKVLKIFL